MHIVTLKPQRKQLLAKVIGLALCVFCMLLIPSLCLPIALLLPLFACPLIGHKQQWAAFIAVATPALISFLSGGELLYSLSLMLPCGLCIAVTEYFRPSTHVALRYAYAANILTYVIALALIVASLSRAVGGNLIVGLATQLTDSIRTSPNSGQMLYSLATMGLVGLPSGYTQPTMLSFTLDPIFIHQLYLSLQRTLELSLSQLLPSLFVQASLLGGLFTTLHTQRMNQGVLVLSTQENPLDPNNKKVEITLPTGFSQIQLPSNLRFPLTLIGLGSLLCAMTPGDLWGQMSLLLWAVFLCVFELLGAAVLTGVLITRKPNHKVLWGWLAAGLFVLFPISLFLLGALDPMVHFRTRAILQKTQPDKKQQEEE